jgi:hypothetical protein
VSKKNKNDNSEIILAFSRVACSRGISKTQLGLQKALLAILVGHFLIKYFNSVYRQR